MAWYWYPLGILFLLGAACASVALSHCFLLKSRFRPSGENEQFSITGESLLLALVALYAFFFILFGFCYGVNLLGRAILYLQNETEVVPPYWLYVASVVLGSILGWWVARNLSCIFHDKILSRIPEERRAYFTGSLNVLFFGVLVIMILLGGAYT